MLKPLSMPSLEARFELQNCSNAEAHLFLFLKSGPALRLLGHVLAHRASEQDEELAIAKEAHEKSAHLVDLSLGRLRYLQPQGGYWRTFHKPDCSKRFQFLQVSGKMIYLVALIQHHRLKAANGVILRVFFDPSDSADMISLKKGESSSWPPIAKTDKKHPSAQGIASAFGTLVQANVTNLRSERNVEEVQGSTVLHRYEQRTGEHNRTHVQQTRHGLFPKTMSHLRDGYVKHTTLHAGSIERVVIVDAIGREEAHASTPVDPLIFHVAARARLGQETDRGGDHESTLDKSDAAVSALGYTEMRFVFARTLSLNGRRATSARMVADHPGLAPIDPQGAARRGRGNESFWHSEAIRALDCQRDATLQTQRVRCFQAMTTAMDHTSDESALEMYTGRVERMQREPQELVRAADSDARFVLDAIAAARSKRQLASFIVLQSLSSAAFACESGSVSLLRHAIFVAHSLDAAGAEVAKAMRSLSLLNEDQRPLGLACTEQQRHETREMATLAYGTLARKSNDSTVLQRIQTDLLAAAEDHPQRRSRAWGTAQHSVQHEHDYSTLLYAVGNTGAPADVELERRTEGILGENLDHPVLSVRVASINALRHHRSERAKDLVRTAALDFHEHEQFRRAAISSFLEQNREIISKATETGGRQRQATVALLEDMLHGSSKSRDISVDWDDHPWTNSSCKSSSKRGVLSLLESLSLNFKLGMQNPLDYTKTVGTDLMGLSFSASANNYLELKLNPFASSMHLNGENHALILANLFGRWGSWCCLSSFFSQHVHL